MLNPTPPTSYSGTVAMWQYTNRGRVDGIEGYVDMNVAYFSYDSDADPFDPDKPHDDINVAELGMTFTGTSSGFFTQVTFH